MEEELESEMMNDTMLVEYYYPYYYHTLHHTVTVLLAVTGLIAGLMIIYTVARSKILHNKTYILLMNFCINDAIFLVLFPIGTTLLPSSSWGHCIREGGVTCIFSCIILIIILLINPIMSKDSITPKAILLTLYIPMSIMAFIKILCCFLDFRLRYFEFGMVVLYGLLILLMISFEIITICKKQFSVVDDHFVLRFNLCRIYTYNLTILILLLLLGFARIPKYDIFIDFVVLTFLLNSFYMIMYMLFKDKKFQMCIRSVLRRDNYKIDATLNSGECTIQETA